MLKNFSCSTRFILIACGALFVAANLFLAQPIAAKPGATIAITSPLDVKNPNDGLCTLREAVDAIWFHAASGPAAGECPAGTGNDTITLPAATYTLTDTASGHIVLTQNTILNGAGAATTIIQGGVGWNSDIIETFSNTHAQISGVTIRGGNNSGYGGGIFVSGSSTLALNDSIVTNNAGFQGGGLYNYGGVVTITNSTIQLNTSSNDGGGVYAAFGARTTLSNTNVLTNTGTWGGGVYNHSDSALIIFGGNIISNTAQTGSGGGVFNYSNSSIAISGTVLTKNAAQNYGGGISNMSVNGVVTIINATVTNNLAGFGAGISSGASGTRMAIDASSIANNIATGGSGGGIYNSSLLTITNSALANNVANPGAGPVNGLGGGLFTVFTTTITNTTISSNQAYTGGGIYADAFSAPNLTITFATIAYNQANLGGGMYLAGSPITNLRNTILALNQDANQIPDCAGSITSLGYNLIGNNRNCVFAALASDLVGTNATPLNPDMRGLGNYGGATQTHALNWTSPAIDQIPNGTNLCGTTITTDQRGRTRPHHGKCDIGAYEGWLEPLNLPIIYK